MCGFGRPLLIHPSSPSEFSFCILSPLQRRSVDLPTNFGSIPAASLRDLRWPWPSTPLILESCWKQHLSCLILCCCLPAVGAVRVVDQ
ncbi:hypothetical protein N656DRAFT_132544 [Canariomyces notabilis]|uniref:Uncharacterized protein n=1 Tax=Canariomyces notabilis TaxID=2074819 RepID=A0AAN6YR18_9PEZI|nr:hypothetical protein N656DRAFT_132544 [Canariomyces arenarius]